MSRFNQFNQNPISGLGVQEGYPGIMGPGSGLLINQRHSFGLEFFYGLVDIFHLKGDMMDPFSLLFYKLIHHTVGIGGLNQLHIGLSYRYKGDLKLSQGFFMGDRQRKHLLIEHFSLVCILYTHADVGYPFDLHKFNPPLLIYFFISNFLFYFKIKALG
jgi:hypothetical protein